MRKSTVIATCLVNSNMLPRLDDAEVRVRQIFHDEFPTESYPAWDRDLDDRTAEQIIANVGRASHINVRSFIEDLSRIR